MLRVVDVLYPSYYIYSQSAFSYTVMHFCVCVCVINCRVYDINIGVMNGHLFAFESCCGFDNGAS